ncbi:MAG TPA: DUF3108 domain-containing protein [Candidatus Saccharimonadales bacterium]|nr:DUF3108 domain-containing protein [Candidatus Saccharimonadales bacterium]
MALLVVILLIAGGWFVFSRYRRRPVEAPPVASNWPTVPAEQPAPPVARASGAPSKEAPPVEPIFALRPGEKLFYDANIAKLNSTVAKLEIVAVEKRNLSGRPSWHLQASAHTENPYRMVFELDDQFDSYSDAGTMVSRQYEMHLSERGQKVDSVQRLFPSAQDSPPPGVSAARVLPGTRDPLGMLNYLRGIDWNTTNEVRSPVYDGRKLYDVRARLVSKAAPVTVPAGSFKPMKIELQVLDNGVEMKDAHFLLYVTNDERRLPVLLEAVLPFASARVELTKAE